MSKKIIPTEFPMTIDGKVHFVKKGDYIKHASQRSSVKYDAEITKDHIKQFLDGLEKGQKEIVAADNAEGLEEFTKTFNDVKADWEAAVGEVERVEREAVEKKEKEEQEKKEKAEKEQETFELMKDENSSINDLSKLFDSGENMDRFVAKGKVTDKQLFAAFNASLKMGDFTNWMKGDLIVELENRGQLNVITKMAEAKAIPFNTLYRYAKTAREIPPDDRKPGISFTIYCEYALAKYPGDEKAVEKIKDGLLTKINNGELNTQTVRAEVKKAQGKKAPPVVLPEDDEKKVFIVVDTNAELVSVVTTSKGFPKELYLDGAMVIDPKTVLRFAENGFKKASDKRWEAIPEYEKPVKAETNGKGKAGAKGGKKK